MASQKCLIHKNWFPLVITFLYPTFNSLLFCQSMKHWVKMIRFIGGLCLITVIGITYLSYICHNSTCSAPEKFPFSRFPFYQSKNQLVLPVLNRLSESQIKVEVVSFDEIFSENLFDIMSRDVIVFLHIQKTGGTTFGRHLVKDLNLLNPCVCPRRRKRCDCFRPNTINEQWLFSRYSTGWKCGLHADWTELTDCVEDALDEYEGNSKKRRYFFITVLRDPVHRYLSEFRHVQRGATWKSARHWCGGQEFPNLPHCYKGANWTGVEIDDFMNCTHNLAHNRQTRMLADLNLVGCYNSSITAINSKERDQVLLASAKANLARMAYFGLTEQQSISQYIFEKTFRLEFVVPFEQSNLTLSSQTVTELSESQLERIKQLNSLDAELYAFSHQLLMERFNRLKKLDPNFHQHWMNIVRPNSTSLPEAFTLEVSGDSISRS